MSVNIHSRLSTLLFENPELITVVNRFGITLGVGDKSIETLCHRNGADPEFVVAIINVSLGHSDSTTSNLKEFAPALIVDYLRKTNSYYATAMLPNIERHLKSLVNHSEKRDNLDLLKQFFHEAQEQLQRRIRQDEDVFFPALLEAGDNEERYPRDRQEMDMQIADKFADLANFFIVHLKGKYDHNLCRGVVTAIVTLSKDIARNNELRLLFS